MGRRVPGAAAALDAGEERVAALRALVEGCDRSDAVDAVIQAAVLADRGLERDPALSTAHLVGQVRSMATDLLRALGLDRADAVARIRRA